MAFSFNQQKKGNVFVLEVKGYLNLEGGKELRLRVSALLEKNEKLFVIDFREAPLVSSQALGQILDLITEILPRQSVKLVFVALSDIARLSMATLGILEYIPDFPTLDEAINSFKTGG